MKQRRAYKPSGYWTPKRLADEAKKHTYFCDLDAAEPSVATIAHRLGIWDKISAHLIRKPIAKIVSDEELLRVARLFKTRQEVKDYGEEEGIRYYGFIKERRLTCVAYAHMEKAPRTYIKPRFFTDQELFDIAEDYTCQRDFRVEDSKAHAAAYKRGLMKEVCAHMILSRPRWFGESVIMRYLFEQKIKFIDEYNPPELRAQKYRFDFYIASLNLMIEHHGIQHYVDKQIGNETLADIQARDKFKKEWCAKKKIRYLAINGQVNNTKDAILKVLKAKLQSLGVKEKKPVPLTAEQLIAIQNCCKWTKAKAAVVAAGFTKTSKFTRNFHGASNAAKKNGWWDEITAHMDKPRERWSKKRLYAVAKPYTHLKTFIKEQGAAYVWAHKHGCIPKHLKKAFHEDWEDEEIFKLAGKCKSRTEFETRFLGAASAARRLGIFDDACAHMERLWEQKWVDKETVRESAALYNHPGKWKADVPSAYTRAVRQGWLVEVTSHMERLWQKKAV